MTQLFRKYVHPDFPEMTKLASDSALLFVNGNEFLDPVRPLPSKVIQIGGVGLSKPPALSDQWIEMAHKGKKGFILFSLGTAAPTIVISEQNKRQIVQAFTQFPDYQFIVKADREDEIFRNLSLQTSNVDVVSWLPQTGLLSHPNAKLFITHGGYNSILESSLSGVPMLVMPLFFDQHHNAKTAEYRGIARALKPNELNANVLRREINILLNDPSYKINAKRISKLSKMKPNQPDETLLNWVNFALANGPLPELRPELLNLSFISYNNIDLLGIGVAILFIIFQLIRLIVSFNVMNRIRVIQKTKSC
jgi:glucuronosyltransferase